MPDVVNKPIADDDPRLAAVGTLWADGRVISHAAVLAPGIAVAPPFGAAQADILKIGRRSATPYRALQITARNPFAVLSYSDLLGGPRWGRPAAVGAKLTFVAYDEKADRYFSAEGRVATTPGLAILLNPGFSILPSWTGAPAFNEEGFLIGMIGRGAGGPILLDVLPLDEMLASSKDLAQLLPPGHSEQARMLGRPTAAQEASQVADQAAPYRTPESATLNIVPNNPNAARSAAQDDTLHSFLEHEKDDATANPYRGSTANLEGISLERITDDISQAERDEELWALLMPSARSALAQAEAIRQELNKKEVHTEYLIAGLLPSWKSFFARSGVDEEKLREIVARLFGDTMPSMVSAPQLDRLPPLSTNTREARTGGEIR